jgi:tRNA A-37 threonylcarbamoyl transferase component Bud32/tetratricopeptide (TPR) repeat protein
LFAELPIEGGMLQPPQPYNAADPSPMVPPLDPIASLRAALRGHYEFEREIGQGAFATVYLARDLKHERKVAVKVLHADPSSETGELRFIREIRLLARLQHPNILPLHDSGHVEALLYYVMPYVSGETLRDRIDRERQLAPGVACNIARDVADALAYAHAQGVIHRDIKPENILLSAGHPVLADFGIARAIDLAGVRQLTRTGRGSPGTPAYMSPEQLMGDKELDGRSDTYSLGCVLFEMLTGKPPFAGKEGFVKRFTEDPPRPSSVRKDLPPWMDGIVTMALAKDPGDRYQTAQQLATALTATDTTVAESHPGAHLPVQAIYHSAQSGAQGAPPKKYDSEEVRLALLVARGEGIGKHVSFSGGGTRAPWFEGVRKHRISVAVGAGLLLIAAVALQRNKIPSLRNSLFAADIDSTRVAVLPFAGNASQRERERITNGLYASLSEWRGLHLASDQDVVEAARTDGPPTSTRAAAALARSLGAGRFIWGQVSADDPSQVRAEVYDAASGATLKSASFDGTADRAGFALAVRELLKIPDRPAAADGGDGRTASYSAWTSYGRGHVALRTGAFTIAEKSFRDAIAADPEFGPARVWFAQVQAWTRPYSRQEWQDQVAQGMHAKSGLSERDHLIALALSSLADKRYSEACAAYSRIVSADSLDFTGLYGMGQCRAFDSLVVPSPSSPSRWLFRSRYSDAATAFMKAVSVNPAAHSILSFDQVQVLLPVASTKTRRGMNASGQEFAAYPALVRDTVVFVPYPLPEFSRLSAREISTQQSAALSRNLDVLLDFVTEWTRDAPQSAAAYQALGDVLEARGEIARTHSAEMSAIQAIDKARQLAATPHDHLVAATSAAWLLFKQGEFAHARILADSILAVPRGTTTEEAATIIGLSALTGKLGKTSELARVTFPYGAGASTVPIPVLDAAAPFFAFASLGVCGDTTTRLEQHLDDQIAHYVAENDQPEVMALVKARALSMLASCTGGKASLRVPSATTRILAMQQALAKGESGTLKSMLANIAADARTQRPGDIALDFAYQVAWLRAASGDTAGAARQLDRTLGGLPSMAAISVREPASAAAAGRAMAFRAELAAARGETGERQKWARAVADIWATADAPLQPIVARMRSLAAPTWSR